MKISLNDLQNNRSGKKYEDGYRIVCFTNDAYQVYEYCKTIEGFMMSFVENDPIMDDDDIPPFVSIDDLLEKYLDCLKDKTAVAIYKTDGTCIAIKERNGLKNISK